MIKTTRNPKFLRRAEKVTVTMDGKTKDKEGEAWRNL